MSVWAYIIIVHTLTVSGLCKQLKVTHTHIRVDEPQHCSALKAISRGLQRLPVNTKQDTHTEKDHCVSHGNIYNNLQQSEIQLVIRIYIK